MIPFPGQEARHAGVTPTVTARSIGRAGAALAACAWLGACEVVAGIHDRVLRDDLAAASAASQASGTGSSAAGTGGASASGSASPSAATAGVTASTATAVTGNAASSGTATSAGVGGGTMCDNYVFVTKAMLGGNQVAAGADAACATEAKQSGNPLVSGKTSWAAVYSTSAVAAAKHVADKVGVVGGVCRPDGALVAAAGAWWTTTHLAKIAHADGSSVAFNVWTGSDNAGQPSATTCQSWTSIDSLDTAEIGQAGIPKQWADSLAAQFCDQSSPVYCISSAK